MRQRTEKPHDNETRKHPVASIPALAGAGAIDPPDPIFALIAAHKAFETEWLRIEETGPVEQCRADDAGRLRRLMARAERLARPEA